MLAVVMGVSGSGKTTIGQALAGRLDLQFADADDFHSEANKAKMAAGHALDDTDRAPWLASLNTLLQGWHTAGAGGVLACSALKQSYRAKLSEGLADEHVCFVLLELSPEVLAERLSKRHHAFMSPALLGSQLATLESDGMDITVRNEGPVEQVVDRIVAAARTCCPS